MNNMPTALRPIYTTDKPNENVVLYEGSLELCYSINQQKVQVQEKGKLEYVWFPNPRIQFSFSNQVSCLDIAIAKLNNTPFSITLSDLGISSVDVFVTLDTSGGSNGNFVSGRVKKPVVQGNDKDLAYILFHVVNFHDFRGRSTSIYDSSSMVKIGTAYLGLWYLELTLLAMFNYQGNYSNRLENDKLTDVPWSK